jgi:hypothetical protein
VSRALALLAAVALPVTPALAAERTIGIGSVDRLRVDGAFEVRVAGGTSPSVRVQGDRDAIDAVEVRQEGTSLLVRRGAGVWGERPRDGAAAADPVTVLVGTPALATVNSVAGARVTVTGMRADRVDLAVTGAGAIAATGIAATDVNATVVGAGTIAAAGRTVRTRLTASGPGGIDAAQLEAGDAIVRLEGVGQVRARARYTAQVSNIGLGSIEIAGPAKCVIRGQSAGPIRCEGSR